MADDAPLPYLRTSDGAEDEEIPADAELYFVHKNAKGELHCENGPAMEFGKDDPRNRYFLDGHEVDQRELAAYAQAKQQAAKMEKAWQDDQVRQLTDGASRPVSVRKQPLRLKKP